MSQRSDPRRSLLLALRRQVKSHRRFDVDYTEGADVYGSTCRTCGTRTVQPIMLPGGVRASVAAVSHLAKYWMRNGTISGECPTCTKTMRDEKYPLNPKQR
jgi:hypothetical protein